MVTEPALLKSLGDYLVHILIFLGAVGGSLKASVGKVNLKICNKTLNVLIGIFCGITVAGHYSDQLSPFLAGILSLAISSVSIVILEDIILLAPKMLDWWISRKFNIDKSEIEEAKKEANTRDSGGPLAPKPRRSKKSE